jgi:ferric-dicitrate binding protein FerR (iron transport regulator)
VTPAELESVWRLAFYAQDFEPAAVPDPDRFRAVQARVHEAIRSDQRPASRIHLRLALRPVQIARLAAAAVVLVAVGIAFWMRPVVFEAPYAAHQTIELPDGSQVELNSGSRLTYRRPFGRSERRVDLRGEAFFDIVTAELPFTVQTFNGAVTVLGTRFNVRAWPDDDLPETVVVLEEGAVRLATRKAAAAPVLLQPGEMSRIPGDTTVPTLPVQVELDRSLAWRAGGLVFENQPIGVILNEVERRFNTRVQVRPASLRDERLSLVLTPESAEEVLSTIAGSRGYTYQPVEGGYLITAP